MSEDTAIRVPDLAEGLPTIQLTDVVRDYRVGSQVLRALDRVSLRMDSGQFSAIVGPSGAGKSTLLHLLGGLDSPTSGSIRFNGREISQLKDAEKSEFRRHSVGFVFQFFNLMPTMTAWENVAVPKLLDGIKLSKAKPAAIAWLERVGLAHRAEHRPSELSGGEMQRVAVARGLVMDPPLILADEPTGNLDTQTGQSILDLFSEVAHDAGSRRAVVMVTHNRDAAHSTDRVIELKDGRLLSDTSTSTR
jgi:putative ABC transport system ATP-binding protein